MWEASNNGILTFKDAYNHLNPDAQSVSWGKLILNSSIPPSRSFLLWRPLHNKVPTDYNLRLRGCIFVSMCSLCKSSAETSHHLFIDCNFVLGIWSQLFSSLHYQIDFNSFSSPLRICHNSNSSQLNDVKLAGIVNVLWTVWFCRNQARFHNVVVLVRSVISLISAGITLTGRHPTGSMLSSIEEFQILRAVKESA